jgi:hypothetical protein
MDTETRQQSGFIKATGKKLWGDLDIEPDEVLFLAWRQKQSPRFSDKQLRAMWAARKDMV